MSNLRSRHLARRTFGRLLPLAVVAWTVVGAASSAAEAQPYTFPEFQPNGEFVLYANRQPVPSARIYFSRRAGAWLVEASVFPTSIMINTRTRCVEAVQANERRARPDGGIDVVLQSTPCRYGRFTMQGRDILFRIGDTPARLRPKPPVLGSILAQGLMEHTPEYVRKAQQYRPDTALLRQLAGSSRQVRVVVFFGSWCHSCGRIIPKILRVEAELEKLGAPLSFDYWGLPAAPAFYQDPNVRRMSITKVPVAFLYVGDTNIGRIETKELERPEAGLASVVR